LAVNPRVFEEQSQKQQAEGCLMQGISRSLMEELKWDSTHILSRDWATYPVIRFKDMPKFDFQVMINGYKFLLKVTPQVAQNDSNRRSAIDGFRDRPRRALDGGRRGRVTTARPIRDAHDIQDRRRARRVLLGAGCQRPDGRMVLFPD
jgi:hypothetical protein